MKTIAVLMGGPSSEHDISYVSGMNVLRALRGRYNIVPVFITTTGEWLVGTEGRRAIPEEALRGVDVVFNALHGEYGEDGKVQQLLEQFGVPYTGSGVFSSALAMHKEYAQEALREAGLRVPESMTFRNSTNGAAPVAREVIMLSSPPWVVKPVRRGSSVGVSIVKSVKELPYAFSKASRYDDQVMAQQYIKGREITCGVLEDFGGERYFGLPPVEIIPPAASQFFDYQVKYNGTTREICPTDFYEGMLKRIRETAVTAHRALCARHYSRTDMILDGTKLYVLEVNTLPGLTSESLFPKAARTAGLEFPQFLDHVVKLAVA